MSRDELSVICQSASPMESARKQDWRISSGKLGAPSMIRTCDLLVRSQTLYPAELRAPRGILLGAPVRTFVERTKRSL